MRYCFASLLLLASVGGVRAQPSFAFEPPRTGTLGPLTPIVAPLARCVALSDALGLIAFGHDRSHELAHISLVRLDAKGEPGLVATSWKLPRPDALAKFANYPLGLAFHPKLPLLYVWQDIAIHFGNPPAAPPPGLELFDHLLIYDVSKEPPALLAALVRGKPGILYGQSAGGLAVDGPASFLYVPNVHDPKNYGYFQFGRFPLDADGLPNVLDEKDAKLPRDERLKKLAQRSAATPLLPPQVTPFDYGYIVSYSQFGAGATFHPLSAEAVLSSAAHGLVLWRPGDKDSLLNALPLKGANHVLFTVHPSLPLVYAITPDNPSLFRVRHADGYPTLLPEQWLLKDRPLTSAPVVLPKLNKLAVGGRYRVYVATLDKEGRPLPEVTEAPVFNPAVRTLLYSERFERVYVSMEMSK